jgi:diacylglycerol kinase
MSGFLRGFAYAFRGIRLALRGRNMRVHLLAALVVAGLILVLPVTGTEVAILAICTASVLSLEALNTAVERLCDLMADKLKLPFPDERIRNIKDIAAGAVLFAAAGAAVVGGIIFLPKIIG